MTYRIRLTAQRLRELLNYDQETGLFTWKDRRGGTAIAGAVAGSSHTRGYRRIIVDGHKCFAHRLAWLHVYGEWPPNEIDHINGQGTDNRLKNLRLATRSQNLANRLQRNNTSGIKGVRRYGNRWLANITKDSKAHYLGSFNTAEEARTAYLHAAQKLFGEFARVL